MSSATLIDFDDSFTYNVLQELESSGLRTQILHWLDLEALPETEVLVLGPGPGHPDDYQRIFPLVKEWLSLGRPFFGLCLGHQIFWRLRGEEVVRSKHPTHGQKLKLQLDPSWQEWLGLPEAPLVQRYNSLSVMAQAQLRNPDTINFIQDDEIFITRTAKTLSYQFHPESVGTTYRQAFFQIIQGIL